MVLLVAWYGWLAPPQVLSAPVVIATLGLPLFLVLRGLLHARPRTVAWSLFLSLLYFTHGIVEAYSETQARWLALTEVALALCWISGGILYIRTTRSTAAPNPRPAKKPNKKDANREGAQGNISSSQ